METLKVIIASDHDKKDLREDLKAVLEETDNIEVARLSRVKVSRLRKEFREQKPNSVLLTVALNTDGEFKELVGFVRKLRRDHVPQAKIVVHSPYLEVPERGRLWRAGADGWIDEEVDPSFLGQTLKRIASGETIFTGSVITKQGIVREE